MEKKIMSDREANNLVLKTIAELRGLEEVSIRCYCDNKDYLKYELTDYIVYHGERIKRISHITKLGFIKILQYALNKKGYNVSYIEVHNEKEPRYEIFYHLVEYQYSRRRKR